MIYFFSGTPGSGKSLHSAKMIDQWYRRGKNIIANFPINKNFWKGKSYKAFKGGKNEILFIDNHNLTVDELLNYALLNHKTDKTGKMFEKQTLLIIDECQTLFNARTWNDKSRMDWCIFFQQHRKLGYECILVSQDKDFVDKQIRALFEHNYVHRDVRNFKLFGKLLAFWFGGHLFICVKRWMTNDKKESAVILFNMSKYYSLYDSYRIFKFDALDKARERIATDNISDDCN